MVQCDSTIRRIPKTEIGEETRRQRGHSLELYFGGTVTRTIKECGDFFCCQYLLQTFHSMYFSTDLYAILAVGSVATAVQHCGPISSVELYREGIEYFQEVILIFHFSFLFLMWFWYISVVCA